MRLKNHIIDEMTLNDMGRVSNPVLIVTDEVALDIVKLFPQVEKEL